MDIFSEKRNDFGKLSNLKLRKKCKVPAIIYYSGLSIPIFFDDIYSKSIIKNYLDGINFFKIYFDDKVYDCILKDFYKHPFKREIMHFDFQKINYNEYVNVNVFFRFLGEKNAIGLKQGGFLIKSMTNVKVKCLASNIPNFIDIDVSKLEVNQSFFLKDIILPENVNIPILKNENFKKLTVAKVIGSRALEQKVQESKPN